MKHLVAIIALFAACTVSAGGQSVTFPGPGLELAGRLYVPAGEGPFPAIVMLHGCSGMWARNGQPTRNLRFWAEHFRARGYLALLVDSFGPRGETEICTQSPRRVSPRRDRARDAHAALSWLAARGDVDAKRIHLIGWSNGGTSVLQALRAGAPWGVSDGPRFRSGVAYYPGCAALTKSYRPIAPLLIQAGAEDDWTPARHCAALAGNAPPGLVDIDIYPGAHHSFDSVAGTVREREAVSNPNRPGGRGATVGPHAPSREKSVERTTAWLAERDRPAPVPRGTSLGRQGLLP